MPGRPTILITVGKGPIALAAGAGGGGLDILLSSILSPPSPSLWETARYRLKYCLKGLLNPKQPANQIMSLLTLLDVTANWNVLKIGDRLFHYNMYHMITIWL